MNAGYERWPDEPSEGLWIEVRESKSFPARVAHFVPSTFESYARIFHPLLGHGRRLLRWSEVAAIEGTTMNPRIQLPELLRIDDSSAKSIRAKGVEVTLRPSVPDWEVLGRILRRHTASPWLMMGIWEGYGVLPEPTEHQTPWLELPHPHRRYFLVEIPFDRWNAVPTIGRNAYPPNLFWPKDRSWFMNIDIDAASSYVGGTAAAIAEILQSPDLESAEADLEDEVLLY